MRYIDWEGIVIHTFLGVCTLFVLVILGVFVVDGYKEYKAEPKTIACAQMQMDSKRFSFTDSVVCVPFPTRRDTVTIERTN